MTKRKVERKAVKQINALLYSVIGETGDAINTPACEEKAFILAASETAAAQFARTVLGFEVITTVHLENDCIYV